jgi:hypothetical protein
MVVVKSSENKKTGRKCNKYCHATCEEQYRKDKEFKAKERKEMDELYETLKRLYGIKLLPKSFFTQIQQYRETRREKVQEIAHQTVMSGINGRHLVATGVARVDYTQYKTNKEHKDLTSLLGD